MFDHDKDGLISAHEIAVILRERIKHVNEADCADLVDYFDSNGDRNLNYNEFCQILLPCENNA